ncbi:MAG TPA: GTPase Era [Thiotrichaceae bacterium]|jgi:GTP-binding protein Era|nr:GTPase Era [Thiotrichaceae bacterium]HIM08593.1 GTPase Era [Gammaproteobacteria bacterium]
MKEFRTGYVSIIGRPNVGKSTLLNHLVEQKLSIVSRKPQTTRWNLLGIKTSTDSQIIFIDTPGLQKEPKLALNQQMNKAVSSTLNYIDIILFVVESLKWNELDDNVIELLKKSTSAQLFLVLNKVDKIADKSDLLSFIDTVVKETDFSEVIPVSATKGTGLEELESAIIKNLPFAPPLFPDDQVTDRSERFFAAEFIREKLMTRLSDELPYHLSITIEEFKEENNVLHIYANIWVERKGQKSIVIGKDGSVLKAVGREARKDLEVMFDKKVNLKTWVKVKKKWTDSTQALKQFGYFE